MCFLEKHEPAEAHAFNETCDFLCKVFSTEREKSVNDTDFFFIKRRPDSVIWILLGKNQRGCQSMCCLWAVFKLPAAAATHPARAASLPPGNEQAMNRQGKELQRAQIWFHSRKIPCCSTGKAREKNESAPKALKLLTPLAIY